MKKTLTTLGLGACALVALSSCQSTDGDGYGGYEEATMASETAVGEDQLPPWLLEDSGTSQVAAGDRTDYPVPEPGDTLADSGASVSSSQVQRDVARNDDSNDVIVENDPAEVVTHPDEGATGAVVVTTPKPGTATTTPKPTVTKPRPIVTNSRTGKLSEKDKKKVVRVDKPTLVSYKVRKGDSLSEIAKRSGTTVAAIRKASGIKGDTIYAGSTIKVPYTPKAYRAAQEATRTSGTTKHTVRQGETVSGIAAKYGLTTAQVLKANNMTQAQAVRIRPGQSLTIPGKAVKGAKKPAAKSGKKSSKKKGSKRR